MPEPLFPFLIGHGRSPPLTFLEPPDSSLGADGRRFDPGRPDHHNSRYGRAFRRFLGALTTNAPSRQDTCADTWNAQGNNRAAFERYRCHRFRTVAVRRSVGFSPVVFGSRGVGSERSQNDRWHIAPQTIVGSAMRPLEDHLPARVVARLLGIKPKTLAAWRAKGKGPSGFFHVSPTLVVYPRSAVEAFFDEAKRGNLHLVETTAREADK